MRYKLAEARALELTDVLRLGRRDSLEAFVGRNYSAQFLGAAPRTTHLNFREYPAAGGERWRSDRYGRRRKGVLFNKGFVQ